MWWVISASSISWSTRSTTSRRKPGSSSKIPCASCSLTLRWSSVIVAPFRSVDFEHQPSWRTMAFHSSGLQIYRSLGTQPTFAPDPGRKEEMTMKERRSRTIKSRIRELPKQGDGTRALVPRTTVLPRHLEDRRVKTLVRSLSELDEWLVAIIH